ncbi:glutamate--cysteine ligase [Formosimonas limnophila]|uniref:glutamate--cysteine ligase n=1 Tax=Formosimonas limnophila TaxID=1384487 RepID=UPI001E3D62B1|nr:glutamate--cysteine ligase [Formosimonas limnophila]
MENSSQTTLNHKLALLSQSSHRSLLSGGLRGIERETLRVDQQGRMSLTAHPAKLGSTLTHELITTDYSESLMEFITPAVSDARAALAELDAVHRFVYHHLGEQMLWSQSMPCLLPSEEQIPIAWYGTSHIGMLKHVYRRGLALRYGKAMQCIAGIHYNFSLSEDLWALLHEHESDESLKSLSAKDYQSERYIALIRNFHRYSWLLMYLFGASPACTSDFLRGRAHTLESLSDDTLYLPYATSLRMSDLGYQNNAQDGLVPPYNTLREYMSSLAKAVRKPYPAYEAIGAQKDGEWVQINTNVLQIENEFYATIRPKRVIRSGERPVEALFDRGVQYIEVRCMDIDPFEPVGISVETTRFLDTFLLFCALSDSPLTNETEGIANTENFARTVKEGRRPALILHRAGESISLQDWGLDLLVQMLPVAQLLDEQNGGDEFAKSLTVQKAKLLDAHLTPSARVLNGIKEHSQSFAAFALAQSRSFADEFAERPLTQEQHEHFEQLAKASLAQQVEVEQNQVGSFDEFITDYRSRTSEHLCREC